MELTSAVSRYEDFYIIEKGLSKNTHLGYQNDLKQFLSYLLDQEVSNTEKIQSQHIQGFLDQRQSLVTSKTLNREKSVIKNFLLYCLSLEEVTEDFSRFLVSNHQEDFFPSILTHDEIDRLFQVIEARKSSPYSPYKSYLAERDHLMLEMLYALGVRVSELINIRLADIDRAGWCRIQGKGDKIRNLPLLSDLEVRISFYLKEVRPHLLSRASHTSPDKEYLFLNKHGKKLSRIAVWKWVKDIALKAGINKNISPHTFRHTCATHLLQNGADLRVIQELVGHSNIQTTELYTHLLVDDVKRILADYHPLYN